MWKIFAGIICLILGIVGIIFYWQLFVLVIQSILPIILLILGVISIASGIKQMTTKERI